MARYPLAVWKPLDRRIFRSMPAPARCNLHTAVSNGKSLHSMFNRVGGVASHFYLREDGVVEQYIDTRFRAACDLDGNPDTISIETWDGYPNGWSNSSDVPNWTPAQVAGLVGLLQWVWRTHPTIPRKLATSNARNSESHGLSYHRLGVPGYMKHSNGLRYSSSRGKVCPGNRRIAQIPGIFNAAMSGTASGGVATAPAAPTTNPIEEYLMTNAAEQKLDYISLQVKVTHQAAVDERKYIREQLVAVANGTFGRDALNARNAAVKEIITGALAEFAKQIPQVDTSATIKAIDTKVDKVLSELDDVQGAAAEKTIDEIINRLTPAADDVMMSAAEVEALDNPIEEEGI